MLAMLNPLNWGIGKLELLLGGGVVALVVLVLFRGEQLEKTQAELQVSETARQAAEGLVTYQRQVADLSDDIQVALEQDLTELDTQQTQTRKTVSTGYIDALLSAAKDTPKESPHDDAKPPENDTQDVVDPTSVGRERVGILASGMRDAYCQSAADLAGCTTQTSPD